MERYVDAHIGGGSVPVVLDRWTGKVVDRFATEIGAEHAARMLNNGACYVDPHAPVGCHVMPYHVAA